MKNQYESTEEFTWKNRRIFGFPEKGVYRLGILVFYILLFVAINFVTKRVQVSDTELYPVHSTSPSR